MKLHEYITQHKEEFDTFSPQAEVWENLEKRLTSAQPKRKFQLKFTHIKWVAGIAFGLCLGYYWGQKKDDCVPVSNEFTALPPVYAQQVASYASLIQTRRDNLEGLRKENPDLYAEFSEEWRTLEQSYQTLRTALAQNPNQEEILRAMLQNLRWQADILEKQLSVMHTIQTKENEAKDEMVY